MYYKKCPHCGAHLDPGEQCDCHQEKREDAPDAAGTPSQNGGISTNAILSTLENDVNPCLQLREIRQQTGAMAKDAALVVREVFPKFNRQLLAQCEAWEKYGVTIHPEGLRAICKAYGLPLPSMNAVAPSPAYCLSTEAEDHQPGNGLTQCDLILQHLRNYGSITSLEAMQKYGVMRLASRISDLRRLGYTFVTTNENGKSPNGEKTSYTRYSLGEVQDGMAE